MAQMADVTVKANNGTTDVVFNSLVSSAGDAVPAKWSVKAASLTPAFRPQMTMVSSDNGNRTARRINIRGKWPYTQTVNGVEELTATIPLDFTITMPTVVPDAVSAEAIAQMTNFIVSQLVRDSLKSGYSPT